MKIPNKWQFSTMTDRLLKFFEYHKLESCEHFSYFMCWNEPFARRTTRRSNGLVFALCSCNDDICRQTDAPLLPRAIILNTDVACRYTCTLHTDKSDASLDLRVQNSVVFVAIVVVVGGHVRICVNENIFVISRARRSHKFLASAIHVGVVFFFCRIRNLCWISQSSNEKLFRRRRGKKNFYSFSFASVFDGEKSFFKLKVSLLICLFDARSFFTSTYTLCLLFDAKIKLTFRLLSLFIALSFARNGLSSRTATHLSSSNSGTV